MKTSSQRAAALLLTLVMIAAIALVAVSFFAITRNDAQVSGGRLARTRAHLAEEAAFADARNLLLSLTDRDGYLVSSLLHRFPGGSGGPAPATAGTRYTFVTLTDPEQIRHVPLFAGGVATTESLPDFDALPTEDLASAPVSAPRVDFSGDTADVIESYGLTHLSPSGALIAENRFPRTVLREIEPQTGEKFRLRYSWWAEDLEGYPNLDAVGGWTDHHGGGQGQPVTDFLRPGYSSFDPRTLPEKSGDAGLRIPLPGNDRYGWQFPKAFRGQMLTDQVAPGLSPREIVLQPWATPQLRIDQHPYARAPGLIAARHWLSPGGTYLRSTARRREHRFVLGLRPWLERPLIPYGHGYADEGQPRFNLNRLVAERRISKNGSDRGIVEILEDNLPSFEDIRRGGFPPDESYLATLAASMMDYADEDSFPTHPGNSENDGSHSYRGVDSYCPINEFFVQFEYVSLESAGNDWKFTFRATPYAEFWNPSNRIAVMRDVRLNLKLLEPLGFQYSIFEPERIPIEETDKSGDPANRTVDEAWDAPTPLVEVPPNTYQVHSFAPLEWEVRVSKSSIPDIEEPAVQKVRHLDPNKSSVRVTYELWADDGSGTSIRVDRCGRPDPGLPPSAPARHGFFFNKHQGVMQQHQFFLRTAAGNLGWKRSASAGSSATNTLYGSLLGDPWMTYHARGTLDNASNGASEYKNRATPGFRNFDMSKVASDRPDVMKDQARVRDWPDRGYENPHPPNNAPYRDTRERDLPHNFPDPAIDPPDPAFAPWRIANTGRFFSVTELGNIHDPVMWAYGPPTTAGDSVLRKPTQNQHYRESEGSGGSGPPPRNPYLDSLPSTLPGETAYPIEDAHAIWGGGNTLRIGRPEHELFDQPGARASQLLDLFHAGENGTNLGPQPGLDPNEFYARHDPRDHQPPPTAPDAAGALAPPYSLLYPPELHAQCSFRRRYGHLNLNSVPAVLDIEALLRGPFASAATLVEDESGAYGFKTPLYRSAAGSNADNPSLENSLDPDAVAAVARDLHRVRPFFGPSHLARVLSHSLAEHEALPDHHNDAEAEETFARLFNTTSFSSRHFRIFTYGEVLPADADVVLGRSKRVYEVFLEPLRDSNGEITRVQLHVLSSRSL